MAAKPRAVAIVAVLAVAVAALASIQLYRYLERQKAEMEAAKRAAMATEKVVVVGEKEIPMGVKIEPAAVKVVDWPKENLPQGYFTAPEQVAGRLPLQALVPGDIITQAKLVPAEAPQNVMIFKIPEGHRAITVGVDEVTGVAGFITPGAMVDVVLTTTPKDAPEAVSKIIFQNVPVLAIGQIIEEKEGKPHVLPTVTLDLTPENAEKLAMASAGGALRLLLRRSGDAGLTNTTGATVTKVLTGAPGKVIIPKGAKTVAAAAPKKAAPKAAEVTAMPKPEAKTYVVEVWRNGKMTMESFEDSMPAGTKEGTK